MKLSFRNPMQKTIAKYVIATGMAALAALVSAMPANAQSASCLKYGDVVTLKFSSNGKYMLADPAGHMRADVAVAKEWERYLILSSEGKLSDQVVNFGDKISLLSYHDKFVRANPSGSVVATEPDVDDWERFLVTDQYGTSQHSPTNLNCAFVQSIALKSHHGKYLSPGISFASVVPVNRDPNPVKIDVKKVSWTGFYYNRAFPKRTPSTTGPGDLNACSYRGRWDGANCFVARPTGPGPSIWRRNFYYQQNNGCGLGRPAGGNCQAGTNPAAAHPFIYGNNFYIAKKLVTPAASLRTCRPKFTTTYTVNQTVPYQDALKAGEAKWEFDVNQLLGQEFDSWNLAVGPGKGVSCQTYASSNLWHCEMEASPCDGD